MFGLSKTALPSKQRVTSLNHLDIDSVDSILATCALKPAWYDSIQKDTGELIYVDAGKDETITAVEDGQSLSEKNNRKKGRKFSPLQRRTKDNHSNGKTESGSQLNGKVSCKLTKDVVLHVNDRSRDDNGPLLQRLFGIVTGHVGVDIFGRTIPDQQGDGQISRDDNRVAVHALLPDGSAVATGDILIGDTITAINGMPVTLKSIDKILSSFSSDNQVCLYKRLKAICTPNHSILSGDTITAINGMPVTLKSIDKILSSFSSDNQMNIQLERPASALPSDGVLSQPKVKPPNGKIIKLLTERSHDVSNSFLEIPHAIMYLNMVRDSDDNDAKEILYKYPSKDSASKLHAIHGLFVTLGDMLHNITDSRITGTSLLVGEELLHVGYFKWCSELLVVALPAKNASQHQVQCITQQIAKLMNFMFLSLNRAFDDEANHGRLDHLFNLLMFQLLYKRDNVDVGLKGDLPHYQDIFLQMLPGIRWLSLPDEIKLDIDSTITDFEAADFADFSVQHYNDRRPYIIIGSCLLYKGYLLSSHLPTEDLLDIGIYCNYYSLNGLATHQTVGQLVIWREVFPTRRVQPMEPSVHGYSEPQARWFLLIVGLEHSALCVLLEAGGCAFPAIGTVFPDPFYVDQLRATLLHLDSLKVFAACEERLSVPPIPALSSVDWFFPSRKTSGLELGQPPLPPSASSSPMISRLHGQSPAAVRGRKPSDLRPFHRPPSPSAGTSVHVDSDNESEPTSPFPSRTNSSQSSPSMGRRSDLQRRGSDVSAESTGSNEIYRAGKRTRLVPDPYNLGMMQRVANDSSVDHFSATKLTAGQDNTLFHFVHMDSATGIIVCPTNEDIKFLGGSIHAYLLQNFQICCKEIRRVLQRHLKSNREDEQLKGIPGDDSLNTVQEYGILFKCTPPNWTDAKKQPPAVQYWVVGRLVKISSTIKEFYVCYQHSTCQNTIEMAFKLVYGEGPLS
ncbi:protein inturned-like isoform X2 [Apostichopus japonicus]|uniref:protein inturned-like isoform X2 n=1 Tax=Stichopus japonicus TaxID=307972 RepID=UPI003AB19F7C